MCVTKACRVFIIEFFEAGAEHRYVPAAGARSIRRGEIRIRTGKIAEGGEDLFHASFASALRLAHGNPNLKGYSAKVKGGDNPRFSDRFFVVSFVY